LKIADQQALAEIQASWSGVGSMTASIHFGLAGAMDSSSFVLLKVVDTAYNMPFLHACAVLNDALRALANEGRFASKAQTLGALFQDSQGRLNWLDSTLMAEIVDKRNRLAHDGETFPRAECWRFIAGIEAQLKDWQVLT
jgi:hypothetical protein